VAAPTPFVLNMKRHLLLSALLLLPLAVSAETVDLGTHGTLSIDVPKGWRLKADSKDTGVDVSLLPPDGVNAQCLYSVVYVPKGATAAKADVDEKLLAECDQFIDMSVEKKKTLQRLAMTGDAYGVYCLFTDASLVGKPPEKDNFKIVTVGIIWFSDSIAVSWSLLGDDAKGPEFAAMIAAVSGSSVKAK
jgi:hypothetical protein